MKTYSILEALLPNLAVMLERNMRSVSALTVISEPEVGRVVSYEIEVCDVNNNGLLVTEDCCDYDDAPRYRTISKFRMVQKLADTSSASTEPYNGCPFRFFIDGKIKAVDENGIWLEGRDLPVKQVYPRIKTW
ncbi:MAG: hypothetical protein MJZ17_05455 [Bacteroidales bacterium]|nr:hypothetical protein [Bacteroidales bacterium]